MLVVKVYVNEDQIDEIWIHNTGNFRGNGYYMYEVVKPEGINFPLIWHKRDTGYEPLLSEVLKHITAVKNPDNG